MECRHWRRLRRVHYPVPTCNKSTSDCYLRSNKSPSLIITRILDSPTILILTPWPLLPEPTRSVYVTRIPNSLPPPKRFSDIPTTIFHPSTPNGWCRKKQGSRRRGATPTFLTSLTS